MAYTRQKKLTDPAYSPTKPNSETEIRNQVDGAIQEAYDMLQSTTSGSSGADYVGVSSSTGLSGSTVREQLYQAKVKIDTKANTSDVYTKTELDNGQLDDRYYTETETNDTFATKAELQGTVLGQIPDNSLTESKMDNSMKKQSGGVAKYDDVGDVSTLTTTAKTVVGAINESANIISTVSLSVNTLSTTVNGKSSKSTLTTATLSAASWTGSEAPYIYTLAVAGVTTTSVQEILPTTNITTVQIAALLAATIQDGGQSANSITLKAWGTKPTVDIPIRIVLRGDM